VSAGGFCSKLQLICGGLHRYPAGHPHVYSSGNWVDVVYVGLIILEGHVTIPVRDVVVVMMMGEAVTVVGGIVMVVGCSIVTGVHTSVMRLITTLVSVVVYSEYFVAREATTLTETLVSVTVVVYSFSTVVV
jgi:hypothetical protein